jgi:formylmethanofuran dehydrogenase subunit E
MEGLPDLLDRSASLHRHLCPRQVLGVRMGLLAAKLLELDLPQTSQKRLFAFMETDGCAADGVSVATGCWIGRRTMRIVDYGKVAATFVDMNTKKSLRIYPSLDSRRLAREMFPSARSRWHAQLKAYQLIPDNLLLMVEPVVLHNDLSAIISRAGVRVNCDHCGEEIINEREVILDDETLCRACTGNGYYMSLPPQTWQPQVETLIPTHHVDSPRIP